MKNNPEAGRFAPAGEAARAVLALTAALLLAGCSTYPAWLPSAGPSAEQVNNSAKVSNAQNAQNLSGIQVVEVTDVVARRVVASQQRSLFSETLGATPAAGFVVGAGDTLEISIWEAPPASLFGTGVIDPRAGASTSRVTALPDQMVNSAGKINVPFAGAVQAAGRSPQQIEAEVVRLLKGKANMPQVLVRVIRNATSNVTVVGEFNTSARMPLTAKGERLLDAVAAAGGVRQPVGKMTVQITRGNLVQALPLETIIKDPRQNIVLQAGDVVTALHQPLSFTVLGATGKNEEQNFEAQGITLAQALARAGGLQDARADARGVIVFRFEDPAALGLKAESGVQATPEGKNTGGVPRRSERPCHVLCGARLSDSQQGRDVRLERVGGGTAEVFEHHRFGGGAHCRRARPQPAQLSLASL